jgi:hypothetical protein
MLLLEPIIALSAMWSVASVILRSLSYDRGLRDPMLSARRCSRPPSL